MIAALAGAEGGTTGASTYCGSGMCCSWMDG